MDPAQPTPADHHDERNVGLVTDDGVELLADVDIPDPVVAVAAVCHPHPAYGGDRHHPVVDAVFRSLSQTGVATIRFDFRRAGTDTDGTAEVADLRAAVTELRRRRPGLPVILVGYSFGAVVCLHAAASPTSALGPDVELRGVVAIAPPLTMAAGVEPSVPTLLLVPEHDQFCPPAPAAEHSDRWPDRTLLPVAMADHFLAGRAGTVAERTQAVVRDWLSVPSGPG